MQDKEKQREASRRLYYKRKEQGLCPWCGKAPPKGERTLCPECLEKMREKDKKFRLSHKETIRKERAETARYYKSRHICADCHSAEAFFGKTLCPACIARRKEVYRKRYKEAQEASRKARYKRLKEQGICVVCGKRPHADGTILCDECRERRNEQHKRDRT